MNSGLLLERCFNKLEQWRGIATRYDKVADEAGGAVEVEVSDEVALRNGTRRRLFLGVRSLCHVTRPRSVGVGSLRLHSMCGYRRPLRTFAAVDSSIVAVYEFGTQA